MSKEKRDSITFSSSALSDSDRNGFDGTNLPRDVPLSTSSSFDEAFSTSSFILSSSLPQLPTAEGYGSDAVSDACSDSSSTETGSSYYSCPEDRDTVLRLLDVAQDDTISSFLNYSYPSSRRSTVCFPPLSRDTHALDLRQAINLIQQPATSSRSAHTQRKTRVEGKPLLKSYSGTFPPLRWCRGVVESNVDTFLYERCASSPPLSYRRVRSCCELGQTGSRSWTAFPVASPPEDAWGTASLDAELPTSRFTSVVTGPSEPDGVENTGFSAPKWSRSLTLNCRGSYRRCGGHRTQRNRLDVIGPSSVGNGGCSFTERIVDDGFFPPPVSGSRLVPAFFLSPKETIYSLEQRRGGRSSPTGGRSAVKRVLRLVPTRPEDRGDRDVVVLPKRARVSSQGQDAPTLQQRLPVHHKAHAGEHSSTAAPPIASANRNVLKRDRPRDDIEISLWSFFWDEFYCERVPRSHCHWKAQGCPPKSSSSRCNDGVQDARTPGSGLPSSRDVIPKNCIRDLFHVPLRLEKTLALGFCVCLECLLYELTLMPVQASLGAYKLCRYALGAGWEACKDCVGYVRAFPWDGPIPRLSALWNRTGAGWAAGWEAICAFREVFFPRHCGFIKESALHLTPFRLLQPLSSSSSPSLLLPPMKQPRNFPCSAPSADALQDSEGIEGKDQSNVGSSVRRCSRRKARLSADFCDVAESTDTLTPRQEVHCIATVHAGSSLPQSASTHHEQSVCGKGRPCAQSPRILSRPQACDLTRTLILVVGIWLFNGFVDVSEVYHFIRAQSLMKLYVVFNMLEIFERLWRSLGRDAVDSLMRQIVSLSVVRRDGGDSPYYHGGSLRGTSPTGAPLSCVFSELSAHHNVSNIGSNAQSELSSASPEGTASSISRCRAHHDGRGYLGGSTDTSFRVRHRRRPGQAETSLVIPSSPPILLFEQKDVTTSDSLPVHNRALSVNSRSVLREFSFPNFSNAHVPHTGSTDVLAQHQRPGSPFFTVQPLRPVNPQHHPHVNFRGSSPALDSQTTPCSPLVGKPPERSSASDGTVNDTVDHRVLSFHPGNATSGVPWWYWIRRGAQYGFDAGWSCLSVMTLLPGKGADAWTQRISSVVRLCLSLVLALVYVVVHAFTHLLRALLLNIAINSSDSVMFLIATTNNFAEIKSTVFKKFSKTTLFTIVASDAVERFYLFTDGIIVVLRLATSVRTPLTSYVTVIGWLAGMIVLELLVDWFKHYFLLKLNFLPTKVFEQYRQVLLADVLTCRRADQQLPFGHDGYKKKSTMDDDKQDAEDITAWWTTPCRSFYSFPHICSRRLGFIALPLTAQLFCSMPQFPWRTHFFTVSLTLLALWSCLLVLKVIVSMLLVSFGVHRRHDILTVDPDMDGLSPL